MLKRYDIIPVTDYFGALSFDTDEDPRGSWIKVEDLKDLIDSLFDKHGYFIPEILDLELWGDEKCLR